MGLTTGIRTFGLQVPLEFGTMSFLLHSDSLDKPGTPPRAETMTDAGVSETEKQLPSKPTNTPS